MASDEHPIAHGTPLTRARPYVLLVGFLVLAVTLCTPLTEDVLGAFGAAFQAQHLPMPFPGNVYHSWLLRGIGYKVLVYVLARGAGLMVDTRRPFVFEATVKILYYGLLSLLIYGSCRLSRRSLARAGLSPVEATTVCLLGLLTCSHWMQLQAEEGAVVLTLAMMALAVAPSKTANFLAGLIPPLLFACKYVTVVYALVPIAVLIFMGPAFSGQLKRVLLGSLVAGAIAVVFWIKVLPLDLKDGREAMAYQVAITRRRFAPNRGFFWGLGRAFQNAPLVVTGFVFATVSLMANRVRLGRTIAILCALVFVCAIPVVVQGNWFGYHYESFILFSLFAIVSVLQQDPARKESRYRLLASVTLAVWVLSVLALRGGSRFRDPRANETQYALLDYEPRIATLRSLDRQFDLSRQPAMLFLSDGTANYVIRCKSYLRYFFPLPLQRAQFNERLKGTELYERQLAATLGYQGEYVYLEPGWFELEHFPALKAKLEAEYRIVFSAPSAIAGCDTLLLKRNETRRSD